MRSLMPRISGSSDEIIRIASPRSASSCISAWISAFDADVDALRRLVEDEDLRLGRQPARQRDLLLVAAGEGCDVAARPTAS